MLDGVASYVTHGQIADVLLVVAKTGDGLGIFEVAADAAGLTGRRCRASTRRFAWHGWNLRIRPPGRSDGGWPAVQSALDLALVALAGEQAGGARRIFDMTVDYARTRIQFGRPIGGFQALKHMAADLLIEVESSTSAARHAAEQLAEKTGRPKKPSALPHSPAPNPIRSRRHGDPDARRHRLHLGASRASYLRRARTYAQLWARRASIANVISRSSEPDPMADIEDTNPTDAALRAEVRDWLAANWDGALPPDQDKWNLPPPPRPGSQGSFDAGWAVPTWPKEWFGRGLTQEQGDIIADEFARVGAPGARQDRSNLAANTMLAFGGED